MVRFVCTNHTQQQQHRLVRAAVGYICIGRVVHIRTKDMCKHVTRTVLCHVHCRSTVSPVGLAVCPTHTLSAQDEEGPGKQSMSHFTLHTPHTHTHTHTHTRSIPHILEHQMIHSLLHIHIHVRQSWSKTHTCYPYRIIATGRK